jgi:hypothetical protein
MTALPSRKARPRPSLTFPYLLPASVDLPWIAFTSVIAQKLDANSPLEGLPRPCHSRLANRDCAIYEPVVRKLRISRRFNIRMAINSTYFGLLAEFGEANVPLEKIAPKYFGLSFAEARRRAPAKMLPCRVFRLGGQKSPWLVSVVDFADLIDAQRQKGD